VGLETPGDKRAIERIGDVELTENEWVRACNQRDGYWLYVVFDCGTSHPRRDASYGRTIR
jgi:hypothetical protein